MFVLKRNEMNQNELAAVLLYYYSWNFWFGSYWRNRLRNLNIETRALTGKPENTN